METDAEDAPCRRTIQRHVFDDGLSAALHTANAAADCMATATFHIRADGTQFPIKRRCRYAEHSARLQNGIYFAAGEIADWKRAVGCLTIHFS